MLSLLIVILVMVVLFKVTGFMFHIAGKLLGGILGIIGWLILGGLYRCSALHCSSFRLF